MVAASRARVEVGKRDNPLSSLRSRALATPPAPKLHLNRGSFDVIAEYKRRSPSCGAFTSPSARFASLHDRVAGYELGGAAAVSVLTEPHEFAGSLDDLSAAATATVLPVMRKDFLVDPYQIYETRAHGGAGVLLIVRILDDGPLHDLLAAAAETELFVLLEAFDETDLRRASLAAGIATRLGTFALLGINARNLVTLETDRSRLSLARNALPGNRPLVAESSLTAPVHATEAARYGYDLALVGSALMRAPEPTRLLASMIAAGRAMRATACASA